MIKERYIRGLYLSRTFGPAKGIIVLGSDNYNPSHWTEIHESEVPKIQRHKNITLIEYSYQE